MAKSMNNKPMLNAYPDSLGGKLSDIAALLEKEGNAGHIFIILYSAKPVSFGFGPRIFGRGLQSE